MNEAHDLYMKIAALIRPRTGGIYHLGGRITLPSMGRYNKGGGNPPTKEKYGRNKYIFYKRRNRKESEK